jgi:hypothetical protein
MKMRKKMLSRSRGEISITREADYIIRRAQERDSRIVNFGQILLFSTQTGDAWILDPEDHFALCLARDGVEEDYRIVDTPQNFQIHWNAQYEIQDEVFLVVTPGKGARAILGYPTKEIIKASKS